jgi:hypothetical protein
MFCRTTNVYLQKIGDVSSWGRSSRKWSGQWIDRLRMGQIVLGMDRPGDGLSRGRIILGTDRYKIKGADCHERTDRLGTDHQGILRPVCTFDYCPFTSFSFAKFRKNSVAKIHQNFVKIIYIMFTKYNIFFVGKFCIAKFCIHPSLKVIIVQKKFVETVGAVIGQDPRIRTF